MYEARSIGKYELRRRIGKGGMGEVWAAWHRGLEREVALKILKLSDEDGFEPDVVVLLDERGAVLYASPGLVTTLGHRVQDWIAERGIATKFIEPGSPWQNGHNESFNGVFRDSCLNRWLFVSVREARLVVERWRQEYNKERPHGALGQITPAAYAAGVGAQEKRAAA